MTEDDACAWIAARCTAAVMSTLEQFRDLLVTENGQQNLIAPSTVSTLWSRHFVDSAQLLEHAPRQWNHWVDVGSGGGLPGMVVAILTAKRVTLIEPRRLRAQFLDRCREALDLAGMTIVQAKAATAQIDSHADVISARAVAALDVLFRDTQHFANATTRYVLPRGESAQSGVATVRRSWQGVFHVKQSIIDPKSGIVIADGVFPR